MCERGVFYEMAAEIAKPCDCRALSRKVSSVNQVSACMIIIMIIMLCIGTTDFRSGMF